VEIMAAGQLLDIMLRAHPMIGQGCLLSLWLQGLNFPRAEDDDFS